MSKDKLDQKLLRGIDLSDSNVNQPDMNPELKKKIIKTLEEKIPSHFISSDWALRVPYSRDQMGGGSTNIEQFNSPDIVVLPNSVEDVAHICQVALKYGIAVLPVSTGANVCNMAVPIFKGIMIDFKRMNRIIEIDADGLTMTLEPYVPYCRAQAEAHKRNLRLNVPGAPNSAAVLSNCFFIGDKYFSAKFGYGPMEIMGAEIVLPNGKIIRTGALSYNPIEKLPDYIPGKHMKPREPEVGRVCVQSWGPDMTGLPYQGCGGNGIVTKICIKIYPKIKESKTLMLGFKKLKNFVSVLSEICGNYIGYGGICSGPEYTIPAQFNSTEDTDNMNEIRRNPEIATNKIMKPGYQLEKPLIETIEGILALKGRDYTMSVYLIGTKRKVEYDYERVQRIIKDRTITSERPGDGSKFVANTMWMFNKDADPKLPYKFLQLIGTKHLPYDWFLRGGKIWEYNETPTRIMRRAGGFILQSPRMPFGKMPWAFDIFLDEMKKEGYDVEHGEFSTYINSGSGAHYACLELDVVYDPKVQKERDTALNIMKNVQFRLMNEGIFFSTNMRSVRELVESMVMPKLWKITKEIRENLQATVLAPDKTPTI